MGEKLLVNEQTDAGADFVCDFNDVYSVSVACWIFPAETDNLFLYIASDEIDDRNIRDAYGEVARRLIARKNHWLGLFQVKLINSSDPIARDAMLYRDRFSAPLPTQYGGTSIGGLSIDGAYVYPPMSAMKAAS